MNDNIDKLFIGRNELMSMILRQYMLEIVDYNPNVLYYNLTIDEIVESYEYTHVDCDRDLVFKYKYNNNNDMSNFRYSIYVDEGCIWHNRGRLFNIYKE